ncbi:MAG: hypothetical protein IKN04_13530 [Clostridia bacterium]|nr:hypothetical protein [Clostridia bacterium]
MVKLLPEEIRKIAMEAALTINQDNHPPVHTRFDDEVARLYKKYLRAKEVIETMEAQE